MYVWKNKNYANTTDSSVKTVLLTESFWCLEQLLFMCFIMMSKLLEMYNCHLFLSFHPEIQYPRSCYWKPSRMASQTSRSVRFLAAMKQLLESWGSLMASDLGLNRWVASDFKVRFSFNCLCLVNKYNILYLFSFGLKIVEIYDVNDMKLNRNFMLYLIFR